MKKGKNIPPIKVRQFYVGKKLSIQETATELGVSYWKVWKIMQEHGIKARTLSEANILHNLRRKVQIPKNKLIKLYTRNRMSSLEIAKLYGCHHSVILNRLKENNIPIRDAIDANTKYPKSNFCGSLDEKAYLQGFALGDLNVRKINQNGKTITIQGNSTIPDQIALIKHLFENYGPVQLKDVMGFTREKRATIYLNDSFNFLLYKKDKIPSWVVSKKTRFLAFLAGYMEAEGHIRTQKPAWVTISSYDKGILKHIHFYCMKYLGIKTSFRISAKKGYSTIKKPKPYKKDVWQVGVYSKQDILILFEHLKDYMQHKLKIKAMRKAIEQIHKRNKEFGYRMIKR